jgi:iron complex outermembrane receptor protein
VRADAVRFRVNDRLISATNPDDSGDRTLHAVSPSFGLVWRTAPLASLYATLSSSFETPTTTELGNKPDGSAGINPELRRSEV